MSDDNLIAEGRDAFNTHGDNPGLGLNPYLAGAGDPNAARAWHRGFVAARAAKRASQVKGMSSPLIRRHPR